MGIKVRQGGHHFRGAFPERFFCPLRRHAANGPQRLHSLRHAPSAPGAHDGHEEAATRQGGQHHRASGLANGPQVLRH